MHMHLFQVKRNLLNVKIPDIRAFFKIYFLTQILTPKIRMYGSSGLNIFVF